ncbi:MAG TPA: hypothetical protein VIJ28_11000 [Chloroflexota bacterium]|jgi:hypothetical protein
MYALTTPDSLSACRQTLQAHDTLHPDFERLLGTALIDPAWRHRLLGDPAGAVLAFGLSEADARLVANIKAADLPSFVRSIQPLLYGVPARERLAG